MLIRDVLPLIDEAAGRVYSLVQETPLVPLPRGGTRASGGPAFAKLEQLQRSGSFKLRGATNKLMSLGPAGKLREVRQDPRARCADPDRGRRPAGGGTGGAPRRP